MRCGSRITDRDVPVFLLVLDGVVPSVAGNGGLSAQTRWSQRRDRERGRVPRRRDALPGWGVADTGRGAGAAMRGRRIVHARGGQNDETRCANLDVCQRVRYREICPSRQFPSGMWRLRPISPPVAAGGHDRFIGCLDAYEDVRGVRRVGLTPAAGRHIASGNPSALVRARRAPRPSAMASAM